jgi:hypothetical protein
MLSSVHLAVEKYPTHDCFKHLALSYRLADIWIKPQVFHQHFSIAIRGRVFVQLPKFECALGDTQFRSQFLHCQVLLQALSPHMICKASRVQMPVRLQPPPPRISPPLHHQPPLMKSQQTHPGTQTKTGLSDLEKLIPLIRRSPYDASLNKQRRQVVRRVGSHPCSWV